MSGTVQRGVALAAALVLLAAIGWTILKPANQYRVTAYFGQTVGLYSGSDVRILGIPVGTITDVVSQGDRVRVEMLIDEDYDIPADADAIVLAPSLVSDRYVQFAPVYDGGPTMEDGDEVPMDRTATPVELDQVYGALDELSAALGPTGANKNGALSDLIDVGAANLDGNGEALNRTLTGFSQAVETLADNREDLFSSLDNLQTFTSALATIDAQVGQFNDNMVAVMDLLASERQDLADAITLLSSALKDVAAFVRTNSDLVTVNVDRLADVTLALVQQRSALAEVLDVAPAALGNLARAYNPDYGTLDTRDNGLGRRQRRGRPLRRARAARPVAVPRGHRPRPIRWPAARHCRRPRPSVPGSSPGTRTTTAARRPQRNGAQPRGALAGDLTATVRCRCPASPRSGFPAVAAGAQA